MSLGIASQITDDLLDLTGDEAEAGKSLGRDVRKGKLTLPLIHYLCHQTPAGRARVLSILRNEDDPHRHHQAARLLADSDSIDYANRMFGNVIPGWKTDRGHVLILHGYPDNVDQQTFSFGTEPWEVWYYYRIGRQFIFVDKTGFGDYELMVPIWDERTRIR